MGLLEKAGKISDDENKDVKPVAPTPVKVEPEPVSAKPKKAKKRSARASKKSAPKAPREPRKKRAKSEPKVMPDGFDEAGKARGSLRLFIDFAVNFGFIIAIFVGFAILETPTTFPLIVAIILSVFNMVIMPIRFNHSMGNVISRTEFINSRGDNANFIYHSLKNTTIASYFVFLLGVFFGISMLGDSSGIEGGDFMNAFIAICLSAILIPLLDYIFKRTRSDSLGLWEVAFGGVWLVRATRSAATGSQSKFMKRLESMAEYAESRVDLDEEKNE
ncbi:MAG: hypothetical protein CMA62_04070 [Euryarchaeota archaeon]|nr:hypothetical protein [Euryarchaeota archaeon]MBT86678.1 hypothetical protein [Euryarchaeota archaeon]DAC47514.1 MAG TPA: hypothetical protein D7H82_01685 [Candidatus Poseidoniales archaeon]HII33595.1 hypothetical protein [Candidatus Thalassarchaeaceae archaeon]|tara:strand:+ start:145 stop:969 length:825 start_codon:yes stop_codon:yes gene_type:complete